jgi:hypothetical protein
MNAPWGRTIYWTTTVIAALIVMWVLWTYLFNAGEGYSVLPIIPLLLAGVIWVAGWACRLLTR